MATEEAVGTPVGAIETRLEQVFEEFLDRSSKRDEHFVELLTAMTGLLAVLQTPARDTDHSQKAGVDPQHRTRLPDMDLGEVFSSFHQIARREPPAPDPSAGGHGPTQVTPQAAQDAVHGPLLELLHHHADRIAKLERQMLGLSGKRPPLNLAQAQSPDDEFVFLREYEMFSPLSDDTLRVVRANGTLVKYPPGKVVFSIGDPADEVLMITSGIVEVCRPMDSLDQLGVVAYITAGETIGEMSVLEPGDTRGSCARVPEGAEAFVITRDAFMNLVAAIPELGQRLATLFANRLKSLIKKERIRTRHRELQGSLLFFDLATVIQTLLSSEERTGILTVHDDERQTVAELFFEAGQARFAKFGSLQGEEAFYQLFQTGLADGRFSFREGKSHGGFEEGSEIHSKGMTLLLEAARLSDELLVLKKAIPDPNRRLEPLRDDLHWNDEESRALAEAVWNLIQQRASVAELLERLPRCHHAIYGVLFHLLESGQAG